MSVKTDLILDMRKMARTKEEAFELGIAWGRHNQKRGYITINRENLRRAISSAKERCSTMERPPSLANLVEEELFGDVEQ